jgi:hypothetical protein
MPVRIFSIKNLFRLETLIVLYFLALLLFGKAFTKFSVIGPLYLHDAVLLLITLLAINRGKLVSRFNSIWLLLAIALLYLLVSLLFFHLRGPILLIAFRQFNLFLYMGCTFVVFNCVVRNKADLSKPLALIRLLSILSVWLQLGLIGYGFLFVPGFSLFGESDYNYFSPLAVFGIITYSAMIPAYEKNVYLRWVKLIFALLLSTTIGHSSAFLAVFVVILVYFLTQIKPLQRFIAVGICLTAVLMLELLPSFRDVNASWRLLYWKHVLNNIVFQHYLILGNGFGRPYMTYDYALYLNDKLHSPIMIDELYPLARYLAPPHNSLLTIMFHVGMLPALLLFIPLGKFFDRILLKSRSADPSVNFLVYALAGCFVWIMFNVILELPHSATFFWLVYMTTAYALKMQDTPAREKPGLSDMPVRSPERQ